MAASFQAGGEGFAQASDGEVVLRVGGQGKWGHYSSGKGRPHTTWTWNTERGIEPREQSVEVLLGACIGVRYDLRECKPEIFFCCSGVRQRIICGANAPQARIDRTNLLSA